jgi:hypothetical protein
MNQLPREMQVNIFSHLGFKDKLESALTCRDWYSKVFNILYTEISVVYYSEDVLEYVYDESVGHQVSYLRIGEIYDLLTLSERCPNLKSLQVWVWMDDNNWNNNDNVTLAQNWKKLEVIKDAVNGNLITNKLLGSSYMASFLL